MDIGVLFPKFFRKRSFCLTVRRTGELCLIQFVESKKKLTNKIIKKAVELMYLVGFIQPAFYEPFTEFTRAYDLPINAERVHFVE